MARGSTRSTDVNELTKQIIAESVAEEYQAIGITNDPSSLYETNMDKRNMLAKTRKICQL